MQSIISVDPFKCRLWKLHNRHADTINEETCKAEIEAFIEHGQLVPALGRRLRNDPDHEIELIYGARRLFVARHLRRPLLVEVREVSNRDAFVAMHAENQLREDLSPYERGLGYAHWLRTGVFKSQIEIAEALNVSASQVSRLLRLARLPAVVVNAFRDSGEISESWGLDLMEALDDPQRRTATIRTARALGSNNPRFAGRHVYSKLLAPVERGRKSRTAVHDKVVLGMDGAPLFRIRHQCSSVALILPAKKVPQRCLAHIESSLITILQRSAAQPELEPSRHELVTSESYPPTI